MRTPQLCRVIAVATVLLASSSGLAAADPIKCQRTIAKEAGKYRAAIAKVIGKCKETVIAKTGGSPGTLCPDASGTQKINDAGAKMIEKIAGACVSESLASINWDIPNCMGFEGQCTSIPIPSPAQIGGCLECIGHAQVEQALDTLLYDQFENAQFFPNNGVDPAKSLNKCQVTIAKSAAKFLAAKEKILDKCWDAKFKGQPGFAGNVQCPDTDPNPGSGNPPASPGDNKTVEAIKKAEQKKVAAICKACGGGGDADKNGLCDSPGTEFALDDIVETAPFNCQDVVVPATAVTNDMTEDCGNIVVLDLQSYIQCIDCVLEFKADCATDAAVGDNAPSSGIDYPTECNPPPVLPNCPSPPTRYEFTATGSNADYDIGWTGIWHDQSLSTNNRLALGISGCLGSMTGCGQCTLSGPIANGGGAAFANQRCRGIHGTPMNDGQNGSWIQCTNNSQCTGTNNGCTFFYGPPQPRSAGGVGLCMTSEVNGPLTGTLNADTGAAAFAGPWTSRIYIGPTIQDPCPRCISGVCNGGERNGQACVVSGSSALYGDALSYDCPPSGASLIGSSALQLPFSTGTQTRTISAASPACSASGWAGSRCQCDTCNNAAATPCATNADCPPGGICGGLRCLVGSATVGAPCTTEGPNTDPICGPVGAGACVTTPGQCVSFSCVGGPSDTVPCSGDSDCAACASGPHPGEACPNGDFECGGTCARPGQSTQPHACFSPAVCLPGGGPNDGQCQMAPSDTICSIETFRSCSGAANCNPGVGCPTCTTPGQTCIAKRRECFTDNGILGGSTSVDGVASTTSPTLGAFACHPPTVSSAVNSAFGFPGLVRVKTPGTSTIN
jgi:hypothetical protein